MVTVCMNDLDYKKQMVMDGWMDGRMDKFHWKCKGTYGIVGVLKYYTVPHSI